MSVLIHRMSEEDYDDYLKHHGILGQKWYQRNGPPYPLDPKSDYSAKEKRLNNTNKSFDDFKKAYKIKDGRKAFNDLKLINNLVDKTGYFKPSNSLNDNNKELYKKYLTAINDLKKEIKKYDKNDNERYEIIKKINNLEYSRAKLANKELGYENNKDIQKYIIDSASELLDD